MAQSNKKKKLSLDYTLSYNGNILYNPGLLLGVEQVVREKVKSKTVGDLVRNKYRQHVIDAKLGFYVDNPTHWAVYNNFQYSMRWLSHRNFFTQLSLGPGVMRTFLPETYKVSDSGDIEKVTLPGRFYFTPAFSVGIGKSRKKVDRAGWQIKLHTFWLVNYNKGVLPQIYIELGYRFKNKKQIQKKKQKRS